MLHVLEQLMKQLQESDFSHDLLRAADKFCQGFELYMCDSKTMAGAQQLALKQYLYGLETSISPTHDPRQSNEFELLRKCFKTIHSLFSMILIIAKCTKFTEL